MDLPENVDATYPDTGDPARKIHQQHHDEIHHRLNQMFTTGQVLYVAYSGSAWPLRPTDRNDVQVLWIGGTQAPSTMIGSDLWLTPQQTPGADTTPPGVPTGLAATLVSSVGFTLSWPTVAEATAYEVFQDGASLGSSTAAIRAVAGLTPDTDYSMTVRARDAAGNWSEQSAPLVVTTAAATSGSGPSYSVFGATAPDGTFTLGTDGQPKIQFAQGFYKYNSSDATNGLGPNARVVGARIWIPASISQSAVPAEVTFRLYAPGVDLDGVPTQTKVVSMAGVTPGMWVEGLFDVPQALGADSDIWMVSAEFTNAANAGWYTFVHDARASGASPVPSRSGKYLAWAEASVSSVPNHRSARFRVGANVPGDAATDASYGIDVLMDKGE